MVRRQRSRGYTLIIPGRAYSAKARSAAQYKAEVRRVATQRILAPLTEDDLFMKIDYFYLTGHKVDTDNLEKPIRNALEGVAYNDDGQITDSRVVMHNIASSYTIEQPISPDIFDWLAKGEEFVAVIVGARKMQVLKSNIRRARHGEENR